MDLLLQIEDIIEKNGTDFELSKLFKAYIKEYKESLPTLFEKNQGKDFLVKHTKQLDNVISLMYKTILRRVFGNYLPMRNSIPIAIVALGSYGREQLCVHSDIDLLIVYEDIEGFKTQLIIEKLFYLALDAGLKLGHRVHEVSDLFKASEEDITIKTSLMESRFITGSNFTWHTTQRELNKIRNFEQKKFILAKIDEAHNRRRKYPISMQPNIKEGIGGLRDTQLLFWIANTIYGVTSLKDLSDKLFDEDVYKEYRMALELLYRVRSALHLITGKQEDTLQLEYIPQVAAMLGFKEHRKFASKVLEAGWKIDNFTKIYVKKMLRPYLFEVSNIRLLRHNRVQKGIYELDNRIYASYNLKTPALNNMLEMLLSLEDKPHKFDAAFLSKFTYINIDHPLGMKTYSLIRKLFLRNHMYCFLELFYEAGILQELFSKFKMVMHLPQFDGYHQYPVDIHSIKCVQALENIKEKFLQSLYNELSSDEKLLIKVVVLFHDAGKGRKQDHSEVGARLILPYMKKLKLNDDLISRAVTLVRHHILMSHVAFKENIHNEKTLYQFMSSIEDSKNLKLLYILTYADINGVGEDIFNSFNSKLLYDLYVSALEVSEYSGRITDATKRLNIEKKVQKLEQFQSLPKVMQKKILNVESNLFFFKHTPEDIINIVQKATDNQDYMYAIKNKNALTIEIFRKFPINLGYLLSTLSHLDVGSMEIFTLFDTTKYFKIDFIKNVVGDELVAVEKIIENSFDMNKEAVLRDIKINKNEILIDVEHSLTHAEITIQTQNQKGLLAYIVDGLEKLKINIITAKIHSTKHKARDSFLVDKKDIDEDNIKKLYKVLTKQD